MSYFEDGNTVPPPFNMIPTNKTFQKLFKCGSSNRSTRSFIVSNFYTSRVSQNHRMSFLLNPFDPFDQFKFFNKAYKTYLVLL